MAQRHDDLHSMSARQVAESAALQRKYANCQQEYQQVLWERQHPPERDTDELPHIRSTDYTDPETYWDDYIQALTQRIRERAERMRQAHEQTKARITRMLGKIDSQLETQSPTRALTIYGQQDYRIIEPIGNMAGLLDYIIWLYVGHYGFPQKSIRMSSCNHLLFSLERQNYAESSTTYTNQYGTFKVIPDANLNDTTIISE